MCELLVDADVLIKLAGYSLLAAIVHPGCATGCGGKPALLAASRYVALNHLRKRVTNAERAVDRLNSYCEQAVLLEPSPAELRLAADLEEAAAMAGVDLDVGESQLCAIALQRELSALLTGDKRAILAAETLLADRPILEGLSSRLACLEQAMVLATRRLGAFTVRDLVLAERRMDKAIDICFQATNPDPPEDFWPSGLLSYIHDLRKQAPTMLMPGDVLGIPA